MSADATVATREAVAEQFQANRDLTGLVLRDGAYDGLVLPKARLHGLEIRRANFQEADLREADLGGVDAVRTTFTKARLMAANLAGADLRDAVLLSADLSGADLRGCRFSPGTDLQGAIVKGARIDLQGLRMLGDKRGGLTEADLATLEVHDDLAKLTRSFGGFWRVLHIVAVVVFLLPYAAFLLRRYVSAYLQPCVVDCVPLREALGQYILTGGQGREVDGLGLLLFALLLIYNAMRAGLVFKERTLRLEQEAIGLPRSFSLRSGWWLAYRVCQLLFWVNLVLVGVHAYQFMDIEVTR